VPTDRLGEWLTRRAEPAGFRVVRLDTMQPGFVYANKTRDPGGGQRLRSVRYEGVLEVTDSAQFGKAVVRGIGSAKAFGFGLLSLALA
jgi:CRISPR system Cascade subunit CasE